MRAKVIVMAAPNGARKTRSDHSNLPLSIEDTVDEAVLCHAAGASVLHAHVRGANGEHVLDPGLYRELIAEMARRAPGMLVQITSEAVGVYSPVQQVDCIQRVSPEMASMGLREISSNFEQAGLARQFFEWCDEHRVHIQHILFTARDLAHFLDYRERGIIPAGQRCVLFVLGRYNVDFQSEPADLIPFLQYDLSSLDWFTCAFGRREQECVLSAVQAGGHARIGFENNLCLPNGELAPNSAALVDSLISALRQQDRVTAAAAEVRQLLGVRSA